MLVKDLIGAELDYYCAKAAGIDFVLHNGRAALKESFDPEAPAHYHCFKTYTNYTYFMPSEDWRQGGPIIEREMIKTQPLVTQGGKFQGWDAKATKYVLGMDGPTPLIAACRAFVASVFGDEVESIKED